jgi:hypothetical protein
MMFPDRNRLRRLQKAAGAISQFLQIHNSPHELAVHMVLHMGNTRGERSRLSASLCLVLRLGIRMTAQSVFRAR